MTKRAWFLLPLAVATAGACAGGGSGGADDTTPGDQVPDVGGAAGSSAGTGGSATTGGTSGAPSGGSATAGKGGAPAGGSGTSGASGGGTAGASGGGTSAAGASGSGGSGAAGASGAAGTAGASGKGGTGGKSGAGGAKGGAGGTGGSLGGSGGKGGAAGTSGGSGGSAPTVVPTTCEEAHGTQGCCGPGDVAYTCNGATILSFQCQTGQCGWSTADARYECNTSGGADPSGKYPKACGNPVCAPGTVDCDGVYTNGCEVNVTNDPANCGVCGQVCSYAHATGVCNSGTCGLGACDPGFGDCDGAASSGCETPTVADTSNCGSCGHVCGGAPNATPTCSSGQCVLACSGGFVDCDGSYASGCEANVGSDPANCGGCGNVCSSGLCLGGQCIYATCADLHAAAPATPSGAYTIDVDGPGAAAPFQVYCDMDTDGGGWTLVGRSRPGGTGPVGCSASDGGGSFGWTSAQGSVADDSVPYSLGAGAALPFQEVLFGSYSSGKTWADAFVTTVGPGFVNAYPSSNLYVGGPTYVQGDCTIGAGSNMFIYVGYTSNTDGFHFRDVDGPGFGLMQSGWYSCYAASCYGGNIDEQQGMIMVR